MCGSDLRLHPLPAGDGTVVAEPADPIALERLTPACVEYAWPASGMLVRFESPAAAALAEQARTLVGGRRSSDDEALWADHREAAAGLDSTERCRPTPRRGSTACARPGRPASSAASPAAASSPTCNAGPAPVFSRSSSGCVEAFGG